MAAKGFGKGEHVMFYDTKNGDAEVSEPIGYVIICVAKILKTNNNTIGFR